MNDYYKTICDENMCTIENSQQASEDSDALN